MSDGYEVSGGESTTSSSTNSTSLYHFDWIIDSSKGVACDTADEFRHWATYSVTRDKENLQPLWTKICPWKGSYPNKEW